MILNGAQFVPDECYAIKIKNKKNTYYYLHRKKKIRYKFNK